MIFVVCKKSSQEAVHSSNATNDENLHTQDIVFDKELAKKSSEFVVTTR